MLELPPLSLYIHIPWCVKKCPYCDFNSHELKSEGIPERDYIDFLLLDFQEELNKIQGRELISIFIGGGTPSLLSPKSYKLLLAELSKKVQFSRDIEITLEVNPGAYEHGCFQGYFNAGINRLSLGVQSFQNQKLKALGRIHNAEDASHAIRSIASAGFSNFNIDLMHGLPNQSRDDALYDLHAAIALRPSHISWYQLTIEPNTVFYTKTPELPINEVLWDIQQAGQDLLAASGYHQYEISAYSHKNLQARHNLNYWQFGDYIGIGAGAHGKWTCKTSGVIHRSWKTRMPKDYLSRDKSFEAGSKALNASEIPLEFMMNALRLHQGVPADLFPKRTGLSLATLDLAWQQACHKGLMISGKQLVPSERGRLFLNDLLDIFA